MSDVALLTSPASITLSKAAFLGRLMALLIAMLAMVGSELTLVFTISAILVGLTSYLGLTHPDLMSLVGRHPSLAMLDVAVLVGVAAVAGLNSPVLLAPLTTALLVGLWLEERASILVTGVLVGAYVLALLATDQLNAGGSINSLLIPLVYVLLWFVGVAMRRAIVAEQRSNAALTDAVSLATEAEARARFAREIHDSLAKSLQGVAMSASALPTWVDKDPVRAKDRAADVAQAASQAVDDARVLMTNLRRSEVREPLPGMVHQVVTAWERRTGLVAETRLDDVDVAEDSRRYELLAALGEALENVARHAAPCRTTVTLTERNGEAVLQVEDTGKGVDTSVLRETEAGGHFGVRGMRERLAAIGGAMSWDSRPGRGTTVTFVVHKEGLVER
ncbi:sensor histidine kinase [Kribbia dieselivorans]|uniref:sensor histidine kinase n=1 Tax=Kribbia dieselivorans TaxID=331526 RepID=UPI000838D47C|nr:histidine kinase [Kribbia dieselivorans]